MMKNLDYGVIGNCKTAALVGPDSSIDWCCMPDFDAPSVFARLLDEKRGGYFAIRGDGEYKTRQHYLRRTNIIATHFTNGVDSFEVLDFMPRYKTDGGDYHCPPDLVRLIRPLSGRPRLCVDYQPRPNYAESETRIEVTDEHIKHCTTSGKYESVYLYTDMPFDDVVSSRPIELTSDRFLVLSYNQKLTPLDIDLVHLEFERTKAYWMGWVAKTTVFSEYQEHVDRSSLVLKLLAAQKTGAILAAVTTSLPETIGGVRNWDYRFCWLRDASMTISVLTRLGHYNVAKRFLQFALDIVPYKDEKIQIMYGINGRKNLKEVELEWLAGYENSRPVRVGNAAYKQKQNDIYGVLLDVIWQSLRIFHATMNNKEDLWTMVRTLTRHVRNNWRKTDAGIWEFRSDRKHFTFSKILCWVAMDRAAKIATFFDKLNDAHSYAALRDEIKADIIANGCDPETGALTQYYGGSSMDAANLLAEHYGFIGARDPIYVSTVKTTLEKLCVNGLLYRYREPDDFGKPESSFAVCTLWMVKSLHRIGEKQRAREMFEQLIEHANPHGLFSEDMDFKTKRLLGNFPQGYSHLALIDAAMTISGVPQWYQHAEAFTP